MSEVTAHARINIFPAYEQGRYKITHISLCRFRNQSNRLFEGCVIGGKINDIYLSKTLGQDIHQRILAFVILIIV